MPELPEVETIRRGLDRYLRGHKIEDILVYTPKIFEGDKDKIIGAKIKKVRRFAKVLSIDLSNAYSIVVHIKLTGQLIYRGPNLPNPPVLSQKVVGGVPGKHTHVILNLDRGGVLYYNDVRKFGWIKIMQTDEVERSDFVSKLGPEPFGDLNLEKFREIISKYKTPIKLVLMDQEKIGGIGNIYANDALWLAKINPKKTAKSLSLEESELLYKSILKVLENGLKYSGASELTYVTAEGQEGNYQEYFLVYNKEGQICSRCRKARIKKIFMAGRGTYFCPNCQK